MTVLLTSPGPRARCGRDGTFFRPRAALRRTGAAGGRVAMVFGAVWGWVAPVLNLVLILVSLFMILLILIQRGKGGGLAGAFGGAGGSSAFGSRAGDAFTRVTIIVAAVWLLLIMILIKIVQPLPDDVTTPAAASVPAAPGPAGPGPAGPGPGPTEPGPGG